MEKKSEMTKALLGQKLKKLVMEKPFDKITIKMIADEAGVIRATFYNYFQDKYEAMEWMLAEEVFTEVNECMDVGKPVEAFRVLLHKLQEDREYYAKAYEVEGQNSFEMMMFHQIYRLAEKLLAGNPGYLQDGGEYISEEVFLRFQTISFVNGIRYWLLYAGDIETEKVLDVYRFLMGHTLLDLLQSYRDDI